MAECFILFQSLWMGVFELRTPSVLSAYSNFLMLT